MAFESNEYNTKTKIAHVSKTYSIYLSCKSFKLHQNFILWELLSPAPVLYI